jgi:amidophosphoribosyltransferase
MSGIVGIVSEEDCKEKLFYATDYHSHLGTRFGGLIVSNNGILLEPSIHNISVSSFRSKFYEDPKFKAMNGDKGIGVISDKDAQPLVLKNKFGQYAICGTGFIDNYQKLTEKLVNKGITFSNISSEGDVNHLELIGNLINQGKTLEEGIENMFDQIDGSMSLLLLGKEGIYAIRDRHGRTPLALAKKNNSKCIVSETCSFKNLGFELDRFLGPGEIVLLRDGENKQIKKPGNISQMCTFLWVYTGNPAAEYDNVFVGPFKERSGRIMARKDNVDVDYVSGVPDSGSIYADGFANETGIPLEKPFIKYTQTWARSYTPLDQKIRDEVALYKLIVIDSIIKGRRGIITEDSIVRGTQLAKLIKEKIWPAQPKEIHIRPFCPPLLYNCPYLLSTRTLSELFARRIIKQITNNDNVNIEPYLDPNSREFKRFIDAATKDLGVTSLRYQTKDDMITAIGVPEKNLCTYCWTGRKIPQKYSS